MKILFLKSKNAMVVWSVKCINLDISCFCNRAVYPTEYEALHAIVQKILKENQPFERLEMTKEDLSKMFQVGIMLCLNILTKIDLISFKSVAQPVQAENIE